MCTSAGQESKGSCWSGGQQCLLQHRHKQHSFAKGLCPFPHHFSPRVSTGKHNVCCSGAALAPPAPVRSRAGQPPAQGLVSRATHCPCFPLHGPTHLRSPPCPHGPQNPSSPGRGRAGGSEREGGNGLISIFEKQVLQWCCGRYSGSQLGGSRGKGDPASTHPVCVGMDSPCRWGWSS